MKHNFLDRYSNLDSPVHRTDRLIKLVLSLFFLIAVVTVPVSYWPFFTLYGIVLFILILISRIPLLYVLRRSLTIIPFVILIAVFIPFFKEGEIAGSYNTGFWNISVTYSGLNMFINVLVKAWLSILTLVLLCATTSVEHILEAAARLGMPRVFTLIISFMYRYIFIITDEAMRMKQAWESRHFDNNPARDIRTLGSVIGSLFIRSYERSERVYQAMAARGFDGKMRKR